MTKRKIHDVEMQFLTVGYARTAGLDRDGFLKLFDNKTTTREKEGLRPLLLYSLIHPAYGLRYRVVCDPTKPLPISEFLSKAWGESAQLGKPQRLEVKPTLFEADRGYVGWLHQLGVDCTAATSLKSINAQEIACHDLTLAKYWGYSRNHIQNPSEQSEIDALNHGLMVDFFQSIRIFHGCNTSMDALNFETWRQQEKSFVDALPVSEDWDETTLTDVVRKKPSPEIALRGDDDDPGSIEGLKEILNMWPGGRKRLLRQMGVTAKDLDFWFAGKAHLASSTFSAIIELVGLSFDDNDQIWTMNKGSLLVATKVRETRVAYYALSGGAANYDIEAVGPVGSDTLPMRVFLFSGYGTRLNMMLMPRDSKAAQLLDTHEFSRSELKREAPQEVWSEIVEVVRLHDVLPDPLKTINSFEDRHLRWLRLQNPMNGRLM